MLIRENMPAAEYHAAEGINASSIKQGRLSMRHMHHAMTSESTPTTAMQWGTLVHLAVLEPELLEESVTVWGGGHKRGKLWTAFKEDHEGNTIITKDEMESLEIIRDNIAANEYATELLTGAKKELSLFWETETYGKAKCRIDALQSEIVIDVKTTADINPQWLGNTCGRYGYHIQGGWYCDGAIATNELHHKAFNPSFVIIWIESKAPFDIQVSRLDEYCLEKGQKEAKEIAERYHNAKTYFGVDTGFNRDLMIPESYLLQEGEE